LAFPSASRALARSSMATNVVCACLCACATELDVGWRLSCAPTDCYAIGPASGFVRHRT
jgi:hypothetical protein